MVGFPSNRLHSHDAMIALTVVSHLLLASQGHRIPRHWQATNKIRLLSDIRDVFPFMYSFLFGATIIFWEEPRQSEMQSKHLTVRHPLLRSKHNVDYDAGGRGGGVQDMVL